MARKRNKPTDLELREIERGEVGEEVTIETPAGTLKATWLGRVSNGKELARAMRLMCDIADEQRD
jgi:hypothetical protein